MLIALYIGNEMYATNNNIMDTIKQLQNSPLTTPIFSSLTQSTKDPTKLVYNNDENEVFDRYGNYIGEPGWSLITELLKSKTSTSKIQEVYISFSTSCIEYIANLIDTDRISASYILYCLKQTIGFDGVHLDYQGSDFIKSSPIYKVVDMIVMAGLNIAASPYGEINNWKAWLLYAELNGAIVKWFALQCYGAGKNIHPKDWSNLALSTIAGVCNGCGDSKTTCSPSDIQELYTLWRTGKGNVSSTCWAGTPNTSPQNINGGFLRDYSAIKNNFNEYMDAIAKGLGVKV